MKVLPLMGKSKKTGRTFLLCLMLLFAAFPLAGCMKGLFGDGIFGKEVSPPDVVEADAPEQAKMPTINEAPAQSSTRQEAPLTPESEAPADLPENQRPASSTAGDIGHATAEQSVGSPGFSYHNKTLTEDTEWSGEVLVDGALTIAPQATLTIAPGTVVGFRHSAGESGAAILIVQGRIVAKGTNDKPILFRSSLHEAGSGSWQGIMLLASEKKNLLEHCRVEGAETGLDASFSSLTLKNTFFAACRTGLRFQDCFVRISGGGADKCGAGLNLYDSEVDIKGMIFSANHIGITLQRSSISLSGAIISNNDLEAVSAENSKVMILESELSRNGSGLTFSSCEGMVARNRVFKNMDYGISLSGSRMRVASNDITQNGGVGIRVTDGKSVAWGNVISANGRYDLYNAGSENFKAIGNWWGEVKVSDIAGRIYDGRSNPAGGMVSYIPVLQSKPANVP
jgi:hypothetical protein